MTDRERSGDGAVPRAYDARLARRLWAYIRPHQRWIWIGLALLLVNSASRLASTYIVKVAIDDHLTPGVLEGFTTLLALFVGVVAVEFFLRRWQMFVVDKAGQNALYDLRCALFRRLQRLPQRFYDRRPTGTLVGRVTTDVEALQELFSSGVVTILGDVVFLGATLTILLSLNWRLCLVAMCVVPVLLAVTMFIRGRVRGAYEVMRSRLSQMNAFLHEHVGGMPLVQSFNREREAAGAFGGINGGVRDAQLSSVKWESTLSASVELLGSFTTALILWYGGGLAIRGSATPAEAGLTLGTLFAFIDYMQKFFTPLNDLSLKYTVLQSAMTASERVFRLLDEDDEIPEPAEPATLPPLRGRIEFQDVHFAYAPEEPVLRGVSFTVEPGERVAVVGATGAGKTTLLKLLTRLYDLDRGRILLDGVDVRAYPLAELRRRVGVVPQDGFLFEGSILENVRLGKAGISEAAAVRAAGRLHLDEVVARFPGGYAAPVNERGKNLSAGEKQLVSLARVLLAEPGILALDEATSNVDTRMERLLQDAVDELQAGRSSLVIAHRLATVVGADRILVFEHGRLAEEGTHAELLARGGLYRELYRLQFAEEPPDPAALSTDPRA